MITRFRNPALNSDAWIRTCQECGHEAAYRSPKLYKGDTWKDVKCKRCKSEALDYGTSNVYYEYEDD